ncbi:MAG: glutamine--fructose-6-phosphate transaminase (isomerizing) [Gammaproteobacteria bacterium]|nr:glutamine--fructose-6-phosphate transaminase (isomerizing) [Gammaproteobacteria bacterium]
MCGIVGATTQREVLAILMEGLRRLEYRGYDSAGIAVQESSRCAINRVRRVGKVNDLQEALTGRVVSGKTGIAHTRWATHGEPSEHNAHPHMSQQAVCVVHNGIIENYDELRDELIQLGYAFESDTDSETIAHLVHHHFQQTKDLTKALAAARKRLEGAYAIAVIARDAPEEIVAVRGGCPLVVGIGLGEHFVASDLVALRPVTDRFIFLQEGDMARITPRSLDLYDEDDNPVERSPEVVRVHADEMDKGHYRHFMAKEIHEQPRVLRNTLEGRIRSDRILESAFGMKAKEILDATAAVTIVGCGTSYYAASIAKYWIEDVARIPCNAEIASEFRYRNLVVPPGSLFISLSQSGETADTIAALRVAKERDFQHTMVISNVLNSTLVRESDLPIMMNAGPEVSVASTKAFTAMLVDLMLLTLLLGRRRGLAAEREAEVVRALHTLDRFVYRALGLDRQLEQLAEEFMHKNHVLFLGRGLQYPIACEGALKLKELSYIHAEGYPTGELKHGPLALVDGDMPVVAVAPSNELLEKVQSNIEEVKARGGVLYVFTDADAGFKSSENIKVIEVPKADPLLSPIVCVVPLQLLAYHVAVKKGTDVDQPRNLAKSVTVE